jgi:formylglycine-generating enzyme required for sulfatase activity
MSGGRLSGGRVLRGGSWNNNQRNARVSIRNNNTPDNANNNIGFRPVAHVFTSKAPLAMLRVITR